MTHEYNCPGRTTDAGLPPEPEPARPTMAADLATISRAVRRLLTPEQCATLSAEEEAAFGRAEQCADVFEAIK